MTRTLRELPDRRSGSGLRPPQFSIRTLLVAMTITALVLVGTVEVSRRIGPAGTVGLGILLLSVVAHVVGTAIGGKLRQSDVASQPLGNGPPSDSPIEQESKILHLQLPANAEQDDFAPATKLSHRTPVGKKPIVVCIATGAGSGFIIGGGCLLAVLWPNIEILSLLFGSICAAMLGGLFGFLAGTFWLVVRSALREAEQTR